MDLLTITQLKQNAGDSPIAASVDAQLQSCVTKTTKSGKPYLEITLADATDQFTLKIWENLPQFHSAQDLPAESFLRLSGDWTQNQYGLDAQRWDFRPLNDSETADLLTGDPETSLRQQVDWDAIVAFCDAIADPRLHALTQQFIERYAVQFRRTAAARKNHHARRGGLVEHVAQMMRSAQALSTVYQDLNLDLLITGILFHDCGKMWENTYPENGFAQPYDLQGEMLGHIPLGIDLASRLWTDLEQQHAAQWSELYPLNSEVRIHLLHLIASHHGTYEFGSPTLPRTPEAIVLHHIDNIDAKFEMFKQAYEVAPELAPNIQQKQFPLPANLVQPLAQFPHNQNQASDTNDSAVSPPLEDNTNDATAPEHAHTIEADPAPIAQQPTPINDAASGHAPEDEDLDEDDLNHKPFDGLLF
ncbi:HD domain-containing protein [Rubritalea marina]|uniref:HD domain-containing protein n=1 Tax=Rubritalea marina TaxID=361055 RepID=UPI000377B26A|nr:HD domain-containing protein [Rubritalea marina]